MNLEITILILIITLLNYTTYFIAKFFKWKPLGLFCGIIGYSSASRANPDKLAYLMTANALRRGVENTGIYSIETGVIKEGVDALDFLKKNKLPQTHLFIGHVRKSSSGGKTAISAHPFENDNIVLVHNGTLTNHRDIEKKYKEQHLLSDTEIIAKVMDIHSKNENVRYEVLSEYKGTAALLFTDKRNPDLLYAYRNPDRPLHYGYIGRSMYISSLSEALEAIGCTHIKEFPAFYLTTVDKGKVISSIYYKPFEEEKNSNYSNGRLTNIKYKDLLGDGDTFTSKIKFIEQFNAEDAVGRWVRATKSLSKHKSNIINNTTVSITNGQWYHVLDVDPVNSTRFIQIIDDDGNLVYVNKFLFCFDNITYPTGYGYAVNRVTDKDKELLYNDGEFVNICTEVYTSKKNNLVIDTRKNGIEYTLLTCYVRPALPEEVEEYEKHRVDLINSQINSIPTLPVHVGSSKTFDLFSEDDDDPNVEILGDDCPFESSYEELLSEGELTLRYVLSNLEDHMDDIEELVNNTQWPELQKRVSALRELITESYSYNMVRQFAEDDLLKK